MTLRVGGLPAVRYVSLVPGTGYGDAADQYMTALRDAGMTVSWTPVAEGAATEGRRSKADPFSGRHRADSRHTDVCNLPIDPDVVVLHFPPVWYQGWLDQQKRAPAVAMVAWETELVSEEWPSLDPFELVIVPSTFTAAAVAGGRVGTATEVVPHIARAVTPVPGGRFGVIGDTDFVFYTIGTWSTRKALSETIRAFLDAFTADDDVGLVVKTTAVDYQALWERNRSRDSEGHVGKTWWTVASLMAGYQRPPRLHVVTEALPSDGIDQLHTRGDCFVSLTRCEGWGLGSFDAALFGNPSIITGWGGHLDYLGSGYPLLVDYRLGPTTDDQPDGWIALRSSDRWAYADRAHATRLMRWAYEHRAEVAEIGSELRARLVAQYGPADVGARLAQLLAAAAR